MELSIISKNMFQSFCIILLLGTLAQGLPAQYKGVRCGTGDDTANCVTDESVNSLAPETDQVNSPANRKFYLPLEMDLYSGEEPGSGTDASSSEDVSSGDDSSSDETSPSEDVDLNGKDDGSGYDSSMSEDISDNENESENSAYEMEVDQDVNFNDEMLKENFIL